MKGEEERRDPAEINQRILRSFLPLPPSFARACSRSEEVLSRMHYGEAEGRHKTIRMVLRETLCVYVLVYFTFRSATRDREQFNESGRSKVDSLLINEY